MMNTFGSAATVACEECSDSVVLTVTMVQHQLLLHSLVKIDYIICDPHSLDMMKLNTEGNSTLKYFKKAIYAYTVIVYMYTKMTR